MDVVLQQADIRFLDSIYTSLFPLQSFSPSSHILTSPTFKDSALTFVRSVATKGCSPQSILESSSVFPRDSIARQLLSLFFIAWGGSLLLYFSVSTLSYYYLFDRRLEHHPRFLKNQIRMEIELSFRSMPIIAALIVPWFVLEIRGHTLMYSDFSQYGASWFKGSLLEGYGSWIYAAGSCVLFLAGTDYFVYWIHRWLHIPWIYKRLHKPHHKWVVPTPFAALAFHPLDGYAQSVPYHLIPLVLPIHKWVYLSLFVFVNLWTILIHDGDMISGHMLEKYINSPAHHTLHHLYFTCNYGQYFTWADSWGGSYRPPRPDLDPIHESIKNMERKRKLAEKEQRVSSRREASLSLSSGSPLNASTLNAKAKVMGKGMGMQEPKEIGLVEGIDSDSGYEGSEGEEAGEKKGKKEEGEVRRRRR